jgi:hypothetical protein
MLTLFPDEQIVTQSSNGIVTLTTHRICYEYKELGRSYNQNVMLEHVTSCENFYSSQIWVLILGIICFIGGIILGAQNKGQALIIGVLLALIFVVLYFLTKQNYIIISSPSTKMKIKVTSMKRDKVLDFINKVELTKNKRINELNKK